VLVDAAGRKYLLRGSVVLGREAPADLAVGEATVSGRHALLVCKGPGRCFVHDMDSLNGTAVNGTATRSIAPITTGDVLSFGSLALRFEEV
jgi:pSer/pThr/pTyr-binding forkhead associated (FHA) protein